MFTAVLFVKYTDARIVCKRLRDSESIVCRAIVHHEDARQMRAHRRHERADGGGLVAAGNDGGTIHARSLGGHAVG